MIYSLKLHSQEILFTNTDLPCRLKEPCLKILLSSCIPWHFVCINTRNTYPFILTLDTWVRLTKNQGLLKKLFRSCMAVDTENLVSLQMFASFGGDFKPSALSPLSFLHWSNRRRRKRIHTVGKSREVFPVVWSRSEEHRVGSKTIINK